jgi:hypothetical protein
VRHSSILPEGLIDEPAACTGRTPIFRALAPLAAAQKTFINAQLGPAFISAEERWLPALNRCACLVDEN